MGQTPAKMFSMPQPFGSTPQANNVTESQPLAFNQGPGFASASAFDQTQQTLQTPAEDGSGGYQNIFRQFPRRQGSDNPFLGMMQQ